MKALAGRKALIDLGTNSVRFIIAELLPNRGSTIVHQEKIPIKLGEGSFSNNVLTDQAISRTVKALGNFSKTARAFKVDSIKAVATSASREAVNRDRLLSQVLKETGLHLSIISGLEEARLIYLGVSQGVNLGEDQSLIVDIGGGSVEMIVGDHKKYELLDSLPLGAARMSDRFNLNDGQGVVNENKYISVFEYASRHSQRFREKASTWPLKSAYGSSGTIENLAKIYFFRTAANRSGASGPLFLPKSGLRELGLWLGAMPLKLRQEVKGLDQAKVPIIVAGCAVLEAVMNSLDISGITAVDYGLKHGLLAELEEEFKADSGGLSRREESIRLLGRRFQFDEDHGDNVARWARKIADEFIRAGLIKNDKNQDELLYLAALVHDIGKYLSYDNHQVHSWYLIKNSTLMGFDEDEIDLIAYLALNHRRKKKNNTWPHTLYENKIMGPEWSRLALIMRLAEAVDTSRHGLIKEFKISKTEEEFKLVFKCKCSDDLTPEVMAIKKIIDNYKGDVAFKYIFQP